MGMLVEKKILVSVIDHGDMPVIVNDCEIVESFVESRFEDNCENDPYEMSSPQNILKYLNENSKGS